jgi:hypothetical protein
MAILFVKIKSKGKEIGKLHLLGSETTDSSFSFLLCTTGEISALGYICEGAFSSATRLADENGNYGNTILGKILVGKDPATMQLVEKIRYMKDFARGLAKRVERQRPK